MESISILKIKQVFVHLMALSEAAWMFAKPTNTQEAVGSSVS